LRHGIPTFEQVLETRAMNTSLIDKIVNSVLYEGYMLYLYRKSSTKNRQRWNFGIVYPEGYNSEPSTMKTDCLVKGETATVSVEVRFLESVGNETIERKVQIPSSTGDQSTYFSFGDLGGLVEISIAALGPGLSRYSIDISNRTAWDVTDFVSRGAILRASLIS